MIRQGTAQEKQGDLSDLKEKTTAELIDLLARQEKLLANRKFLMRLQDKGEKVENLAEKLRLLIKEREEVNKAARLFEKMDIGQEDSTITHVTERTVIDQSKTSVTGTVKKSNVSDASVVKRENRDKFKPNKDLKSTAIPDGLPRPSIEPSPLRGQGSHERSSMDERDADLSSAKIPPLKNQEAQVVEFSDSAKLLEEQKKHAEALVAKQAAERLTERLHIQMGDFIPEVQQGSYRGGEIDSDDEESEEGSDDEGSDDEGEGDGD
nr:DNA-directed RNA polymerase II subunit GRINL1A-like [Lytechinus pictus]